MAWLGLNTAVSGLFGSQRKLYTVNHNVANASREGYSRQKVNESSSIPRHITGMGYIGTGVSINSVDRIRDIYLDKKYRTESASLGEWNIKQLGLSEIENVLRGSQEEGINVNIDEFFKAIGDLSTDPSDMSRRTAFREKTNTLNVTINETVKRLYKQQKDINFEVKTKVKEINDLADQIKSLNDQIFVMEVDGHKANDLRDQRDIIVDKLSQIVDIEVEEKVVNLEESKQKGKIEVRQFEVRIGGMTLVDHNRTSKLKYPPDVMQNTLNPEEPLYKVEWASGGEVKLKSGELKGLLQIRDGGYEASDEIAGDNIKNTSDAKYQFKGYNGIPYYIKRLDEFASGFASKINEIHSKGINLNKGTGVLLFDVDDSIKQKYGNILIDTTGNIKIRDENGKILGTINEDGEIVDANNKNWGVPDADGKLVDVDGNVLGTISSDVKIIKNGDGNVEITLGTGADEYKLVKKTDGNIVKLNSDGTETTIMDKDGDVKGSSDNFTKDSAGNLLISNTSYEKFVKENMRADNIKLSDDIINDLNNIATIDSEDSENIEDNKILKEILEARESTTFFDRTAKYQGRPEDFMTSIFSTLGTDSQQSNRMSGIQKSIVNGVIKNRLSVSGVDLDEEMADMLKFQQLYNASARMITTFDQIYETTINRLGIVGR
ncbi:FlgK-like protein [Gottschalkia acidurici 9a]|uniref:Flagellar hook-associated protein 1 n=1 Tax=Gottschalkia acidurici (strain ATCC 7906 / DSM 604 / BCRC 14475 / CIP 104303 / KCTC 5404 / NCIMB 10678 / 9a) TaxID=1128398 RepID=K0AX12_GOTA9|nr:flagellar hook-associated protein FlgK [Gottschalkia acidurici]AFS77322.1 FlgK-like protein [Gottschalkia acidurici 9a]